MNGKAVLSAILAAATILIEVILNNEDADL